MVENSEENYRDPVLDPKNQHYHQHFHHSESAHDKNIPAVLVKDSEDHTFLESSKSGHIAYEESEVHKRSTIGKPDKNLNGVPNEHMFEGSNSEPSDSNSGKNEKNDVIYNVRTTDTETGTLGSYISPKTRFNWRKIKSNLKPRVIYLHYRKWIHLLVWLFFTSWWVSIIAQPKHRHEWLVPTVLYIFIWIRIATFHFPAGIILVYPKKAWNWGVEIVERVIPSAYRNLAGISVTVVIILVGTFVPSEVEQSHRSDRAIAFFGCLVFIFGLWASSNNKRHIVWRTVTLSMLSQFIISLFVLRTKCGYNLFDFISKMARYLLGFSKNGVAFIANDYAANLPMFVFSVLPAITFFIAFVQLLYYWGTIQWFIVKFAYFFFWFLRVSGAEAVVAAASPFIGQGESVILVRPFIPHLTNAEIHQVMASGFSTIAGSVLVAYIGMGVNAQALLSSCVMSIPGSLACSKLRYPEVEESITKERVVIPEDVEARASNALAAFSNGAWIGLKISATILANMICIIAIVALVDALLGYFGHFWNINNPPLGLNMILGYFFYPVAFLLGAPRDELYYIAQLLGTKVIQNEFVAYNMLMNEAPYNQMSSRSQLIATYALCSFANLASVGNQLGVFAQVAPGRMTDFSKIVISALITGCTSTLLSAAVASMVVRDISQYQNA